MSISVAMNNAVLGLRAAGRGAEVVSTNVSNALTPGYGRRALALSSSSTGGVRVDGISRHVNPALASDRRMADAENNNARLRSDFYARLDGVLGKPGDPASLSGRLAGLESAFVTAASRPDAPDRLADAIFQAKNLAAGLKAASLDVQEQRSQADRTIEAHVASLNSDLQLVHSLNVEIVTTKARGADPSTLLDQRQQAVDRIGALVPVRSLTREGGQIALYSTAGATLIDGGPSTIAFDATNQVTPYLTLSGGFLSGLTINGQSVRTDSQSGALRGGALSAQFEIRDELGVEAQTELDAMARDLVERFQDPAVDPSLAPGDPGLFTDEGFAFVAANEVGLSERLEIHANVDPDVGGEVWRLRDGINAIVEGPVGEAGLINALSDALSDRRTLASGSFAGQDHSASSLISTTISRIGVARNHSDQTLSFTSARFNELTQQQLAEGVNTDTEIQNMLLVERTYAANARMIEVLDELMGLITRL